jgi:hypothetical protein
MSWAEDVGLRHETPRGCSCRGGGLVWAELIEKPEAKFVFRCSCVRGERDERSKYPSWKDADLRVYPRLGLIRPNFDVSDPAR